jgi:cardiolipin synthase
VFGRSNFEGYALLRRASNEGLTARQQEIARDMNALRPPPESEPPGARLLEKLALLPATRGNHAELLIDGQATFDAIFASIADAREYVLVQFYIITMTGSAGG